MTEKTCDLCGKKVEYLHTLNSEYKQDDIAEICTDCNRESNEILSKIVKAQNIQCTNFMRQQMRRLKDFKLFGK